MPIYASAGDSKTYTPAPEGTHQGVCVDVIDVGEKPNPFKPGTTQHKIDIAWQLPDRREDGKRYVVYKRYTLSLNEKATLRHDLTSWRGRPFTDEELQLFDVEAVLGANALVNVQHATKDGRTYANVLSVMPLVKGMTKISADGYVRHADAAPDTVETEMVVEDDIPF